MIWKNYWAVCLNFFYVPVKKPWLLYLEIERCHPGGIPVNLICQQKKYTHQFDVCIKKKPQFAFIPDLRTRGYETIIIKLIIISLYLFFIPLIGRWLVFSHKWEICAVLLPYTFFSFYGASQTAVSKP